MKSYMNTLVASVMIACVTYLKLLIFVRVLIVTSNTLHLKETYNVSLYLWADILLVTFSLMLFSVEQKVNVLTT